MKTKKFRLVLVLLTGVLILIMSCSKNNTASSSLYTPTSSDVTPTATLAELQQGRTLYMNNCNSCHSLYSPDDYSSVQWKSIVATMGPRTSMSSSDIQLVTKYVTRGK